MITRLTLVTILVSDQDEALKFFTEVLGLEKRQDAAMGPGARWLVVAPKGQADMGIVLQKPEPAMHGAERAQMLTEQIGKGTTWVFRADDLERTYEALSSRGVKFTAPPTAQPWGKQAIFDDPYGNRYALMGH
jgi:predicted enzyme related to lactoylglutathione lyase